MFHRLPATAHHKALNLLADLQSKTFAATERTGYGTDNCER